MHQNCMLHAGSIAFATLTDGLSARAAGCGPAFLDGGCGYDLGMRQTPCHHAPRVLKSLCA